MKRGRHEVVLMVVILVEVLVFHFLGRNFLTGGNVSNVFRHSVEIGLLAMVLVPVILSGGIDLSVGSMIGLCAVAFGIMVKVLGVDEWMAVGLTVIFGGLCGGLNGWLVAGLRMPALIVTLGTYSLFRGLAEALTKGSEAYSGFSEGFMALGNSEVMGVPAQVWIFAGVVGLVWFLVHRTTYGRSLRAIGFGDEGARYAGLPVGRVLGRAYVMTGLVAGLAAVILVARLGEARANAGMGYELLAITAVVLGGVSIFGGRGNVGGALLGWLALAILNNGLTRISAYEVFGEKVSSVARELSGLLTGVLLLGALAVTVLVKRMAGRV